MLEKTQKATNQSNSNERHKKLSVFGSSQSYFALPKTTQLNNSNITSLFKQTLIDVENLYNDDEMNS